MENLKKLVYDVVDVSIGVGETTFGASKSLRDGNCVGVKYIQFDAQTRPGAVNISLESADGTSLIGRTDYRDFINNGGGYKENYKPVNFRTNANININAVSTEAIATSAFSGQLVFMIEQTLED